MGRIPNTVCEQCNKNFYKRPSQKEKTIHDFCCRACFGKWNSARKMMGFCETCGKLFSKKRGRQRFCSKSCVSSRERNVKIEAKQDSRSIVNKFVKMGWNEECMVIGCTYSKTLDAHRILDGAKGGIYTLQNTSVICPNHHSEIHRLGYIIMKIREFEFLIHESD